MILDYENSIRRGITRAIHHCTEENDKYIMFIMKQKKIHILYILILTQIKWALSEPPPYDGFQYVDDISVFISGFIIIYHTNNYFGYKLVVDVSIVT